MEKVTLQGRELGRHHINQLAKAIIPGTVQVEIRSSLRGQSENDSHLCDVPAEDSQLESKEEETLDKPKLRTFHKTNDV